MLALTVFVAYRVGVDLLSLRFLGAVAATGVSWGLLRLIDWERHTRQISGEVLLAIATLVLIVSLALLSTIPELRQLVFVLYFGVVSVTAALGGRLLQFGTTILLIILNAVVPRAFGVMVPSEELVIESASLVLVAVLTAAVATQFRRETYAGVSRMAAIRSREADVARLYEVSRTVAVGQSLGEVLPELVGRIGTYLDAEIGAVLLYNAEERALEVLGPIWTRHLPLDVGEYREPLASQSDLIEVFETRQARVFKDLDSGEPRRGMLGELGVSNAVVVPLVMEGRPIGVMMVADKVEGGFTPGDMRVLESLAAPAALVLSQLERYELAAESSRRMEELAKMKSDFVSVVSHELRTPLTSIIGSLATIARPELAPQSPAAQELLLSARKQSDRLRRLIEDLLMVSRLDNAGLPQHPQLIRLSSFLSETVGAIPDAAGLASVDADPDLEVEADPDHLSRVLRNLIENALKYAPGSPIEITAVESLGSLAIAVSDHGPGIPADKREQAFEPFSQLDPADTRSQGGTGLGLSIVRSLTEQMGGKISLTRTPGGGATFTILLPLRPRTSKGVSQAVASAAAADAPVEDRPVESV